MTAVYPTSEGAQHTSPAPEAEELKADARQAMFYGATALACSFALLGVYFLTMPPLGADAVGTLVHNFPPKDLEAVVLVRDTLMDYAQAYPVRVAIAILMLYVTLQTFAIPGTVYLSLVCGALYGSVRGWMLVALISTLGSTSCYTMVSLFGKPLVYMWHRQKIESYRRQIEKRRKDLLSYMIFLRVTPLVPNIVINMASPIVGVPLQSFVLGTLIGCLPNNFMAAHAGDHLSDLNSLSDLYDPRIIGLGLTIGVIALVPVWLKHKHERKEARQQQEQLKQE